MFASHAYDLGSILNASQTKKQEQQVFPQFNSILYFFLRDKIYSFVLPYNSNVWMPIFVPCAVIK